jgi:hypothetical protein
MPARYPGFARGTHGENPSVTFLGIYLNDQLALGIGFRELARRAARANAGSELGDALARVATGIAEDVETFEQLMSRLGIPQSRVKSVLAVAGERVGRLKLNGRLREYSPLSRFWELDALVYALDNKRILWANLRDLAGLGERAGVDFDVLIERAQAQRDELEPHRLAAGRDALTR